METNPTNNPVKNSLVVTISFGELRLDLGRAINLRKRAIRVKLILNAEMENSR